MRTSLASQALVETGVTHASGSKHSNPPPGHLSQPKRKRSVPPTLGNPFHFVEGASLTMGEISTRLRLLETERDIPLHVRTKWISDFMTKERRPRAQVMLRQSMSRITKSNKRGKYPVFYGIESILGQAFHGPSLGSLTMEVLLDRLLLQLRLTTLMRSVDLSNIVCALFQQDNQFFIRTSDKNGVA